MIKNDLEGGEFEGFLGDGTGSLGGGFSGGKSDFQR